MSSDRLDKPDTRLCFPLLLIVIEVCCLAGHMAQTWQSVLLPAALYYIRNTVNPLVEGQLRRRGFNRNLVAGYQVVSAVIEQRFISHEPLEGYLPVPNGHVAHSEYGWRDSLLLRTFATALLNEAPSPSESGVPTPLSRSIRYEIRYMGVSHHWSSLRRSALQ